VVSLIEDLDVRLHHRSLMESAGLQRIIELCQGYGMLGIDKQLRYLQTILDDDECKLRERLDQEILRDLKNPQDVYNSILARTGDTKAHAYFLSMMQHLLLIREEGQPMVHYYRLIDSLVTDVVMDKKLAGAEQRMGHSVEQIIAQFNEADRYQAAEVEAADARATAVRLRLEKEALEAEIAQGQDGLVGSLKLQLGRMEEKLNISRETTSRLQGQLVTQKAGYEEQITQLETQIMELFRMLKEVGKGVEKILDGGVMDRKTLVQQLEKDFQRRKTISILEGREGRGRKANKSNVRGATREGDLRDDDDDDVDMTPVKGSLRRSKPAGTLKMAGKASRAVSVVDENGRVSQFMDADDADAQEQIQQQIAAGVTMVCRI
jgi:cytokinesis protein